MTVGGGAAADRADAGVLVAMVAAKLAAGSPVRNPPARRHARMVGHLPARAASSLRTMTDRGA
jgi:hypothetical protein